MRREAEHVRVGALENVVELHADAGSNTCRASGFRFIMAPQVRIVEIIGSAIEGSTPPHDWTATLELIERDIDSAVVKGKQRDLETFVTNELHQVAVLTACFLQ